MSEIIATAAPTTGVAADESSTVKLQHSNFPAPPIFDDKYKEREYQKQRLTLAFRIFAKLGFDEGVAGHITLRVRWIEEI
jgi:hypothetical protein